eukprot:6207580-Pleurochrysis_carterae.AAC.2
MSAGLLIEPDFHDVGTNTTRFAARPVETQTEDKIRSTMMHSQATQASLQEEQIVHRWLKNNGMYAGLSSTIVTTFFHHAMSCLRRPAGRADRNGSQQASFSMELPSLSPLLPVLGMCQAHPQARYSIGAEGEVDWVTSPSIDSYYINSEEQLAQFLNLHERGLERGLAVHGSSKGVLPTKANGYPSIRVVVTALPPLIVEVCRRSHGRMVAEVTFNIQTLSDLDAQRLPPAFSYAVGMDRTFRLLALRHVQQLARAGHAVSPLFRSLAIAALRPNQVHRQQ